MNKTVRISLAIVYLLLFSIYLYSIFTGFLPGQTAFEIGAFKFRWYGLLISLGILFAYFISTEILKKQYSESAIDYTFLITVALGLLGARLGFVIQNTHYYLSSPLEILKITSGGLSIHGAIILGLIGLWLSSKIFKYSLFEFADKMVVQLFIAGSIGRWGNFFNQEIIGKPSNLFGKIFIAPNNRPAGFESFEYFHPVFLYESILLLAAFLIYIKVFNYKKYGLAYTLAFYSLARIIVEPLRIDYKPTAIGLDLAQMVSFAIIILAFAIFIFQRNNQKLSS